MATQARLTSPRSTEGDPAAGARLWGRWCWSPRQRPLLFRDEGGRFHPSLTKLPHSPRRLELWRGHRSHPQEVLPEPAVHLSLCHSTAQDSALTRQEGTHPLPSLRDKQMARARTARPPAEGSAQVLRAGRPPSGCFPRAGRTSCLAQAGLPKSWCQRELEGVWASWPTGSPWS